MIVSPLAATELAAWIVNLGVLVEVPLLES